MTEYWSHRTVEEQYLARVVCNGCGKDVDLQHEVATRVRTSGGYSSPVLLDCTKYSFDLCEACVVKTMDGLVLPPLVVSMGDGTSYRQDREARRSMDEDRQKRTVAWNTALGNGVCPWPEDGVTCGRMPVAIVDETPTCSRCVLDWFTRPATIVFEDETWDLARRRALALDLLSEVTADFVPQARDEFRRLLLEDSLVAALGTIPELATAALKKLTGVLPPTPHEWVGARVAVMFGPEGGPLAVEVNRWLAWAKQNGFAQSAASVCLGHSLDEYWHYYDRDLPDS